MNERVWSLIETTESCWHWTGYIAPDGYGRIWIGSRADGRRFQAHRYVYESLVGLVPEGLQLDHLCRVRNCVNPAHLEPVTARENALRGLGMGGRWARRTHCSKGHEFTPENTQVRDKNGRRCLTCQRQKREARATQRDAEALGWLEGA